MLKASYATQDEIPEGLRDHYKESDGVWVLDGYVSKTKLAEFRENNRALAREKEEMRAQLLKFKDIDPEKYQEALLQLQELENQGLFAAGEWKTLKAKLDQTHADLLKVEKGKTAAVQENWNKEKISNRTAMIILRHAIPEEGNMKYIQADVLEKASIDPDTNEIVFIENDVIKRDDEGKPLTLEKYLVDDYIPNSKLFKKSAGSGALGADQFVPSSKGEVPLDKISNQEVSSETVEKLASGEMTAV